jgi:hypothetical protein
MYKQFGKSGTVYYVVRDPKIHWKVFVETENGFEKVVAKHAALDIGDVNLFTKTGRRKITHEVWREVEGAR